MVFFYRLLESTFLLIQVVLIARFLLCWAAPGSKGRLARRILLASEPYVDFRPVKKLGSWLTFGGLEASPVIAFLLVTWLRGWILGMFRTLPA